MKRIIITFWAVVVIIIVMLALSLTCQGFKVWLDENRAVIGVASLVGVLGLVFSMGVTVYQFNATQEEERIRQHEERTSRIEALDSSVQWNISMGEIILGFTRMDPPQGAYHWFHLSIIEAALVAGDLTDGDLRWLVQESYGMMTGVNKMLSEAARISELVTYSDLRMMRVHSDRADKRKKILFDVTKKDVKLALEHLLKAHEQLRTLIEQAPAAA